MKFAINKKAFWIIGSGIIVTSTLGIVAGAGAAIYFGFDDWATRANFGASFGAVSALFSALAFAGVVLAQIHQAKTLKAAAEANEEAGRLLTFLADTMEHQRKSLSFQSASLEFQRASLDRVGESLRDLVRIQVITTRGRFKNADSIDNEILTRIFDRVGISEG